MRANIIKRFQKKKLNPGGTAREKRFFLYVMVLTAADFEGENGRLEGPPYAF
jgi:hypothetical protein